MSTGSSSTVDAIIKGIFSGSLTDAKYQYLSIIGLLYQVGINIAIGAGAFLVFVVLRPTNARVYARRYKHMKGRLTGHPGWCSGMNCENMEWMGIVGTDEHSVSRASTERAKSLHLL
ncbi:hypothetical protein DL89DRAFT_259840 [Linderina pennispora]|uniref:CSC1/OSCA1-like N-terminal transmembrane domain-containing protein n=1 Tax=Linderina pennispora TaxID=61395 RepID=A0A1Y1VZM8_9FUNG|nr:uncharacterized protein DL89DRAFT_259840 [Linderina pennispora]ORX66710.1 hypothetical protein DL89DRAFT_259840 [Linderina pennispora]